MNEYQEADIRMDGEALERDRKKKWKNRLIWLGCLAVPMLEIQLIYWMQQLGLTAYTTEVTFKLTLFAILLGAWAWLLAKERLPAYYDENRVTIYVSGLFRLRIPGLAINNRNWPYVLKAIRVWTAVTSILPMTLSVLFRDVLWWLMADEHTIFPILFPAALILPVIFLARWYELEEQPPQDREAPEERETETAAPAAEYQVDKARVGEFISGERKRLGLTQRELAGRLYLSDKAVSKWERGLSVPDVGLLIPLAELLGVTVTELLEGRHIQSGPGMEMREVEQVVKKALNLTGEAAEVDKVTKRRHRLIWIGCTLAALFELWAMFFYMRPIPETTWVLVLLAVIFGGWAWMGAKERLPAYYDQNRISFYTDGIFKLHMGGMAFNNRNWPHILKSIRIWSIVASLLPQLLSIAGGMIFRHSWFLWERFILLPLFLGGLFVPVYVVGLRYEKGKPSE